MKAHSFLSLACSAVIVLGLSACGTVSNLKTAQGKTSWSPVGSYSKVTVQDFSGADADVLVRGVPAGRHIANRIASNIRVQGGFATVSRNAPPDDETLVIDGTVNDVTEGNAALRQWIGLGAGTAFLSADVHFLSPSGSDLGVVNVRKNSFPFGGLIAGRQSAAKFMDEAGAKVATEARRFRK